ncbi:hypothetical protein BSKO_11684 [Bryopsis sp. KO-2023]|nr:hypothetical protein BSKO_11684 [Bryopsis sp. KO-2023]
MAALSQHLLVLGALVQLVSGSTYPSMCSMDNALTFFECQEAALFESPYLRLEMHFLTARVTFAGILSVDSIDHTTIDKPETHNRQDNHYAQKDATLNHHQKLFNNYLWHLVRRHNECRIYTTEMAYFANRAVMSGCSADLVLACKRKLYHFDKYGIRVYGGGAYVHYIDVAGFNRMNYYLIGVKIPCRYKGLVSVQIHLPNVHVPELIFEKAAFVPVRTSGVLSDFQESQSNHHLHKEINKTKYRTGHDLGFSTSAVDVFGDYLGTEKLVDEHIDAYDTHFIDSFDGVFKGHSYDPLRHSFSDHFSDAGYSRHSHHGFQGHKHAGHLSFHH